MKEKDLYVDYKPQQHVYYVEKEDQHYGPVISGSFLAKNYLDDYWFKQKNLELSLRKRMLDGEISPVYYYMTLQELSVADLASRVKISRSKLKKHFHPEHFSKMGIPLLKKYAEVFDIPVSNLFQIIITKEEEKEKFDVTQLATKNPSLVLTKIECK